MKRHLLFFTLLAASFAAACSGGSSSSTLPPPVGPFSNASLKGQYAFLMSGQDVNGFFARVGTFSADGSGNITGGIEDVNSATGTPTLTFSSSTYSVLANGRGTVNLTDSTGTLTFSIAMTSSAQGFIVETDGIATASGTFILQNSASFTLQAISNSFVFDVSGIDPGNSPDSIIGEFQANGAGGITTGILDENNGAASGPVSFRNGSYQMDAANPGSGRGTITFGGLGFVFYIVDGTRVRLLETGSFPAATVGDAISQTPNIASNNGAFTGSFALLVGGSSSTGPFVEVGRFTADGNGGLSGISLDLNDNGTVDQVPNGTLSATTYSMDAANPGSGRGTATFTDSTLGTFSFKFYLISPHEAVIQDVSTGFVADGVLLTQSGGPFTSSGLAGNYSFNWSGISTNNTTGITAEEDFAGQLALTSASTGNVSGAMDFSEFSSTKGVFIDVGFSGGLTLNGDGTTSSGIRNALSVKSSNSPSTTFNFIPYVVDSNTIFLVGSDNTRVIAGTLTRQP